MLPTVNSQPGIKNACAVLAETTPSLNTLPTVGSNPVPSKDVPAIAVINGNKSYHKGQPILEDFNMTVPANSIYALLGSSGCGKTTILSCCVGIRKLDSGHIKIFGYPPGSRRSGVPGRRVGYMPQDISLYSDLTIEECLAFYGRVYGMVDEEINEATEFLLEFLDLPKPDIKVRTLSGGQQRRASIAVALIHDPELLILDEPTVGLDPILRESIWGHVLNLVAKGRTTVVVTTHYIDEARQANCIGIMRNGHLLREESPESMMQEYNTNSLEEVLLILCRKDQDSRNKDNILTNKNKKAEHGGVVGLLVGANLEADRSSQWLLQEEDSDKFVAAVVNRLKKEGKGDTGERHVKAKPLQPKPAIQPPPERIAFGGEDSHMTLMRMKALLRKEVVVLKRNLLFLGFMIFVPAFQVILCNVLLGTDPKEMPIAIVSKDGEDCTIVKRYDYCPYMDTDTPLISCFYVDFLKQLTTQGLPGQEEKKLFKILNYDDDYDDVSPIERTEKHSKKLFDDGSIKGYLVFEPGFSEAFGCRYGFGMGDPRNAACGPNANLTDEQVITKSKIRLPVENAEFHYSTSIANGVQNVTHQLMHFIKDTCGALPKYERQLGRVGDFMTPIKEDEGKGFKEYLSPALLMGLLFFFTLCSSCISYISERKNGTLERMIVAGVTPGEFMGAFLITQFVLLMGQSMLALSVLYVFGIEVKGAFEDGNILLVISIYVLVGVAGMSLGFVLAMVCDDEAKAVLAAIGSFFPNCLLSGMIHPLKMAEWKGFMVMSYLFPCTLPTDTLRSIQKGEGLKAFRVWVGFASTFGWIIFYWILALAVHRHRKS